MAPIPTGGEIARSGNPGNTTGRSPRARLRPPRKSQLLVIAFCGLFAGLLVGLVFGGSSSDRVGASPIASSVAAAPSARAPFEKAPAIESADAPLESAAPVAASVSPLARGLAQRLAGFFSTPSPELDPGRIAEMDSIAHDGEASPSERVDAIRWLGRVGTDESVASLVALLARELPPALAREAAAALGRSSHPEVDHRIEEQLASGDVMRQQGAIRALALRGGEQMLERMRSIAVDPAAAEPLRMEAIAALGGLADREAGRTLQMLYASAGSDALAAEVLAALAARPFAENRDFMRSVVADDSESIELRAQVLESLASASPGVLEFLTDVALDSPEPALRRASIGALAQLDPDGRAVMGLVRRIPFETDAALRIEIYRGLALPVGEEMPSSVAEALVSAVLIEKEPYVRTYGARAVALRLDAQTGAELFERFDRELVPFLEREAAMGEPASVRGLALEALARAATEASTRALENLRRAGDAGIAAAAERAIRASERIRAHRSSAVRPLAIPGA